ncbi:CHAT domain-containing protein [Mycena polygramma]|nr:CHAT domain-containing protein [Mycena polygramma]
MYTLRLKLVELVSWLVDQDEEQASDSTNPAEQEIQQETETLYIEIDRGGREFIKTSPLNPEFSFDWNFLPNDSSDPMSEVITLRLYYESSSTEGNDRALLAHCHFVVGELLRACWCWDKVELQLTGKDEVCAKLSADLCISQEFREDLQNLDKEIEHHRKSLELRGEGHPEHGVTLYNLANALQTRFIRTGADLDNDAAIDYYRAAAQAAFAPTHPAWFLNNLVNALDTRFEQHKNLDDIDEAIKITKELLAAHPAQHDMNIISLAHLSKVRFEHLSPGNPNDIEELVVLQREALTIQDPTHSHNIEALKDLAVALQVRFLIRGESDDLKETVNLLRTAQAIDSSSVSHPDRIGILGNLAYALKLQFEQYGEPKNLDEVVELSQEELQLLGQHPTRGESLQFLAGVLEVRFQKQGDSNDLNKSIELRKEALQLYSSPGSKHSGILFELSLSLRERFDRQGNASDLDDAITLLKEDISSCPPSGLVRCLRNLGDIFQLRFDYLGKAEDIDQAIELYRRVLALDSPTHTTTLNNLSAAIQSRFQQQGNPTDIDEAVELCRKSLALSSVSPMQHTTLLVNLGMALRIRFTQRGDPKDVDEALQLLRQALQSQATNDADHRKHLDDINKSVDTFKQALELRKPPNPRRRSSLNGLAMAMVDRFKHQHEVRDIEEAIELFQEALNLCPDPHPDRAIHLCNLGNCTLYGVEIHESRTDAIETGISKLKEASTCTQSTALHRFSATANWTKWATVYKHYSALDAYRTRIRMLPEMAAFSLNLKARQEVLTKREITSLSSLAAAFALSVEEPNVAVEFLEASRSIFWSQALNLRTPLDNLATVRPDLAITLTALARQLEQASFREIEDPSTATQSQIISAEAEAARCRKVNKDWEETMNTVRSLPGFEEFLYPKSIKVLRQAAVSGPVVILLVNSLTCSALIVKPCEDVFHLPLPAITVEDLELYSRLPRAISSRNPDVLEEESSKQLSSDLMARLHAAREGFNKRSPDDILRAHLAELWNKIVKPVFGALSLKKSQNPSRLWWCPTGMFAFLPIHAAGTYDANGTDCVSDYVISSYTTTLAGLLNRSTTMKPRMLTSPWNSDGAYQHCKEGSKEWLTSIRGGTGKEVVKHLQESSAVHFACHGIQDRMNPLESGLMLSDGRLKVSQIIQQAQNEESRKTMSLAFLSACEAAKGDNSAPDEAMHLAATLLFAGFDTVVATMWTMDDRDGPKVADTFYEYLFQDYKADATNLVRPDLQKTAEALHSAVAKLRKEPDMTFVRWVPFVHYGL